MALHAQGSNCAQSVLCAFSGCMEFDTALAHRLATGLGAGLGRRQLVCGAVTGAAMALGAAYGNDDGTDLEAKEDTYARVAALVGTVEREFGSCDCAALLGEDLSAEEGRAAVKAKGLSETVCNRVIARCVGLVEEALSPRSS